MILSVRYNKHFPSKIFIFNLRLIYDNLRSNKKIRLICSIRVQDNCQQKPSAIISNQPVPLFTSRHNCPSLASSALDLHLLCIVIMNKWEDDCEVDAGIYEVSLHDMGYFLTFAADYRRNHSGKAAKNVKLL